MHTPIFILVGKSGVGKTTLMIELVRHFKGRLGIIKSITTRPLRDPRVDPHDSELYDFMPLQEFTVKMKAGQFLQCDEPHPGNWKASSFANIRAITSHQHGICALTEKGVREHINNSYDVQVILVSSDHVTSDPMRRAVEDSLTFDAQLYRHQVFNSFESGGLAKTLQTLIAHLSPFINHQ